MPSTRAPNSVDVFFPGQDIMAFDPSTFHGIVPPVVTPLTGRFEVDYGSFTRVIEHLIAGGVHGLFVLGSTSEVVFHDAATRRKILDRSAAPTYELQSLMRISYAVFCLNNTQNYIH